MRHSGTKRPLVPVFAPPKPPTPKTEANASRDTKEGEAKVEGGTKDVTKTSKGFDARGGGWEAVEDAKLTEPKIWDRTLDVRVAAAVDGESGSGEEKSVLDVFRVYLAGKGKPCIVCLHGAGNSAMSWALVASRLKKKYTVLSYDLRGHGASRSLDEAFMSSEQLVEDTVNVIHRSIGEDTPFILAGHSLGGALAVRVAASKRCRLLGLVIVDVVEGTALAHLPNMTKIVQNRPNSFQTPKDAVQWVLKRMWVQNPHSASLSIPSQLRKEVEVGREDTLPKTNGAEAPTAKERYVWRTDLLKSEKYWKGWFQGMTEQLIELRMPKVLVLAGRDRMALDTRLTVAQMQGKFQMVFVPGSGHSIQEDKPDKMAKVLEDFALRVGAIAKFNKQLAKP